MTASIVKNSTFNDQRYEPNEIERLYAALDAVTLENHPRTARLLASGRRKVAQKVIEEAGEVALAAIKRNSRNVVRESADLLYQLAVLWRREGILPETVWAEMHRRAEVLGIAEKLPKSQKERLRVQSTADAGELEQASCAAVHERADRLCALRLSEVP